MAKVELRGGVGSLPVLPQGLYAVRALTGDGTWGGAANIGPNPTFGEQARKVEVHLIDFEGDLYGQELKVAFAERLRGEEKFDSIDALKEQMAADVQRTRDLLST